MHCRTCGYLLFNLAAPICPECATPFDLRTYRFKPNTVAFACPLCGSQHAGQGDNYIPSTADVVQCQGCGEEIETATMSVIPLVSPEEAAASAVERVPWERRAELGNWQAWKQTMKLVLTSPSKVGMGLDERSSFGAAYLFAVTVYVPALFASTAFQALLALLTMGSPSPHGPSPSTMLAIQLGMVVLFTVYGFIAPIFAVGFTALPAHLFLRLTGKIAAPLNVTANTVLYSQGPFLLMAIPFCGGAIGGIWGLIATILMLTAAQRVSGLRAAGAVLIFPLSLLVFAVVAIVIVVIIAASMP